MEQPKIEVSLISCTSPMNSEALSAERLLVYTKSTRLDQGKETRNKINNMSDQEIDEELKYMANTIPSSWEFVDYAFEIKNVTRAFTHQFVRTRTGSYAQQTMRLLEKSNFSYRIPDTLEDQTEKTMSVSFEDRAKAKEIYINCMVDIQKAYDAMLAIGIPAEDARGVLPTNIHTNIIAKFNLRTISEMARSRTGKRTQDEYREVLEMMLEEVVKVHPWTKPFLFPEKFKNIKIIEEFVAHLKAMNIVDDAQMYDLYKALDKLRKGDN